MDETRERPVMDEMPGSPRPPRFQFSIGVLMLLVALAAAVSVNVRIVVDFLESLPHSR
jgi:hypothetical protein